MEEENTGEKTGRGAFFWRRFRTFIPLLIFLSCFPIYFFVKYTSVQLRHQRVKEANHRTIVYGDREYHPDSDAAFRVFVKNHATGRPVQNAKVSVSLAALWNTDNRFPLGEWETDRFGFTPIRFSFPELVLPGSTHFLEITTTTEHGADTIEQLISILQRPRRDTYHLSLSSDKPVYQPGQTIHMRSLLFDADRFRAEEDVPVRFHVADPRGNMVFQKRAKTSAFGIASADFTLAEQVTLGEYHLTVTAETEGADPGAARQEGPLGRDERVVTVGRYSPPKFDVRTATGQPFYLPGERVAGTVRAEYFYGKPVAGGEVRIQGKLVHAAGGRPETIAHLTGTTDGDGAFPFRFDLPGDLSLPDSPDGGTRFFLEITVIDGTGHPEETRHRVFLAAAPIRIEAVPESGRLVRGIENIVQLRTTRPDGSPVSAALEIRAGGKTVRLRTDGVGRAEYRLVPPSARGTVALAVTARDEAGRTVSADLLLDGAEERLLLRMDRSEYRTGDTVELTALTRRSYSGKIYLDVARGTRILSSRSAPLVDGEGRFSIHLGPEHFGPLTINAYMVLNEETILRDSRTVWVQTRRDLRIGLEADNSTYRPGEIGTVAVRTADRKGTPTRTALGISVVDESVHALSESSLPFHGESVAAALPDAPAREWDFKVEGTLHPEEETSRLCCRASAYADLLEVSLLIFVLAVFLAMVAGFSMPLFIVALLFSLIFVSGPDMFIAYRRGGGREADISRYLKPSDSESDAVPREPADAPRPASAPRVRRYFPETLHWNPELVTDSQGRARIDLPLADNITTWRLTALASTRDGRLGMSTQGIRVFQDFFVDVDLPASLTLEDEIGIPVRVFNYLPRPRTIRLVPEPAPWFELLEGAEKVVEVGANDAASVYFPIRVRAFGHKRFQVTAFGDRVSDAVRRDLAVATGGREMRRASSGLLRDDARVELELPGDAIPGTLHAQVKIHAEAISQVVEGMERILRMPDGCFEQTASTTYPNVMILRYLDRSRSDFHGMRGKAERNIGAGYQRMLTYEMPGGGFSLFGEAPAEIFPTAYGLMVLGDMAEVFPVDRNVIHRTARWLLQRQKKDGTWDDPGKPSRLSDPTLAFTAYTTWALCEAELARDPRLRRSIDYLRDHAPASEEPFVLAMASNAFAAYPVDGPKVRAVREKLYSMGVVEGGTVHWRPKGGTFTGAYGASGRVETTALAAIALGNSRKHRESVRKALHWLIRHKGRFGAWNTTQATILSLKALENLSFPMGSDEPTLVRIRRNEETIREVEIDASKGGAARQVHLDGADVSPLDRLTMEQEGNGAFPYRMIAVFHRPWEHAFSSSEGRERIDFDVRYARRRVRVNETVAVSVEARLKGETEMKMALMELGIPPGFSVAGFDLALLVEQNAIGRYDIAGNRLLVYLENLSAEAPVRFDYSLRARYPMRAKTPPSELYDYYNPDVRVVLRPTEMVVESSVERHQPTDRTARMSGKGDEDG